MLVRRPSTKATMKLSGVDGEDLAGRVTLFIDHGPFICLKHITYLSLLLLLMKTAVVVVGFRRIHVLCCFQHKYHGYTCISGTPLRPKAARVEPHTCTKRRPKRHAGNFLWSLASGMTRGRVRTYVAFHDILTCSNFCAAASQGRARNRVSLLTRVAQATRVEVK